MSPAMKAQANMWTAIGVCQADNDARVCTHNDFQQMCGSGFNGFTAAPGWYGDHGKVANDGDWVCTLDGQWLACTYDDGQDDEYGTWNYVTCGYVADCTV
jgi:hypothetical protein